MLRLRQYLKIFFIVGSIFLLGACAEEDQNVPNLNKGFALANGEPISQPDTDDYNPQVIVKPDGYLILIFGSNRANATGGGTADHAIWVTQSTGPFDPVNGMPAFNTPTQLTLSLSTESEKIAFSAQSDGGNGAYLAYTEGTSGSSNMYFATFNDLNDGEPDNDETFKGPTNAESRTGTVIGNTGHINPAGKEFIYTAPGLSTPIIAEHAVPSDVTDGSLDTQGISAKSVIASVPSSISGLPNSYFFINVDDSGFFSFILAGSDSNVVGEPIALNDAIFFEGLVVGSIDTFAHPNGDPFLSGMVFSAGFDTSGDQNLYYVNSHDLFGLWELNLGPQNNIAIPDFFPDDIAGIETWFDATYVMGSPGLPESSWSDVLGNVTVNSSGVGPVFGGALFTFGGAAASTFADNPTINLPGSQMTVNTIFAVASFNSAGNFPGASTLAGNGATTAYIRGTGGSTNIATDLDNGQIRINGNPAGGASADFAPLMVPKVITAYSTSGQATVTDFTVGALNNNNFWDGQIFEIITYNRQLSMAEIEEIEEYLSFKYGLF